jgi:hypothetical protein
VNRYGQRANEEEGVAGCGAFSANGRCGGGFAAGGEVVPAARGLLGADYNDRDYAVIVGRGSQRFLAAIRWYGARGGDERDCVDALRGDGAGIRNLRVSAGAGYGSGAFGSKRISVRRCYFGDRDVVAATRTLLAGRVSPVRGSFHRDRHGADLCHDLAREQGSGLGGKGWRKKTGAALEMPGASIVGGERNLSQVAGGSRRNRGDFLRKFEFNCGGVQVEIEPVAQDGFGDVGEPPEGILANSHQCATVREECCSMMVV